MLLPLSGSSGYRQMESGSLNQRTWGGTALSRLRQLSNKWS